MSNSYKVSIRETPKERFNNYEVKVSGPGGSETGWTDTKWGAKRLAKSIVKRLEGARQRDAQTMSYNIDV